MKYILYRLMRTVIFLVGFLLCANGIFAGMGNPILVCVAIVTLIFIISFPKACAWVFMHDLIMEDSK